MLNISDVVLLLYKVVKLAILDSIIQVLFHTPGVST